MKKIELTIKLRIVIFGIVVASLGTLLNLSNFYFSNKLSNFQQIAYTKMQNAQIAQKASHIGDSLNMISSNFIIDRAFATLDKELEKSKLVNGKLFIEVEKFTSTDMKQSLADSKKAYEGFINILNVNTRKLLQEIPKDVMNDDVRDASVELQAYVSSIRSNMHKIEEKAVNEAQVASEAYLKLEKQVTVQNIVFGVVIGIVIILMSTWLYLSISRPQSKFLAILKDVSEGEGDLTKRLDDSRKDELGEMAKYFNLFVEKLQKTISSIQNNSRNVSEIAANLESISENIYKETENAQGKQFQ